MVAKVDPECGQKRQRLAHFQDVPAELVGTPHEGCAQHRERVPDLSINRSASRRIGRAE